MRDNEAVAGGNFLCCLSSNCTGYETCENDGKDKCVYEKLHDVITSESSCFRLK